MMSIAIKYNIKQSITNQAILNTLSKPLGTE